MKRLCWQLTCLFILSGYSLAAEWANLTEALAVYDVELQESDGGRTVLHYNVNRYSFDQVDIGGKEYILMQKPARESIIEEKGYPRLPRINRSIVIPDDGVMGYSVISADYIEVSDINIAPSKGYILRSTDPATIPYTFSDVYQRDAFFPAELVTISKPYILRDYRGVVVELNAFQWNPVTRVLRIYTDITIEVKKSAPGGENVLNRRRPLEMLDPQFAKIYHRHFINFSGLDYPTLFETGEMLIICCDNLMDEMAPFVEWKTQKGIPTSIVPVSEVGNDWRLIQGFVRDVYESTNLTYVLLVGDAAQLTTVPEDSGSDPVYSLLDGEDSYPDIFVGRFSAETHAQVETQVTRTINYEKYPQLGADWYHRGIGAASDQGAGYGHYGEADNEHMTIIAYKLLDYNYTQVDSSYAPWGTGAMISHSLNEGRSILNYCGHGGPGGWGPPAYGNDNVNALVNVNMLPYVINVACGTGDFVEYTCFGETWLRATHDLTGEPTGGIGAYMSRTAMGWTPGMDMQDEAVDLLVSDSMLTFGGLCFNGSMLMIDVGSGWGPVWEFKNLTIFGDPSVFVRSNTPFQPEVTHNDELPIGESSFEVVVIGPNGPVKDAMVCGMSDNIYASAVTNSSGQAALEFVPPPTQAGRFTLTISGGNAIPYIVEVDVIDPSGPYVAYSDHTVQDDSTGNSNGQLDYAETVELGVTVENIGAANAVNVIGILQSDDPLVDITQNTTNFGDIRANSSATVDRAFAFETSPEVRDGDPIIFMLTTTDGITSWESNFSIVAHAPDIVFLELAVDDITAGNGNTNLDPGETADLLISLVNAGSSNAGNVTAILSSFDPYISINATTAEFGPISVGETAQATFNVTVATACPAVYSAEFEVDVSDALGYINSTGFCATVSDLPFLPSGPDDYGYLAYDGFDVPLMPEYNWVELHPDSGGSGMWLPFVQLDQVYHDRLPFQFQYYGIPYDSLTISNKGYLCLGIVNEVYYNNFAIPDTNGSGAMIAGYWYDLVPMWNNSGEVWQWYDAANHRYIVEYNHIPRYWQPDSFETFEIILLDPAYHTTLTGDGQILFQYKEMSGSSTLTGTIGIENHSETDGIQYRWNALYDMHAHPIENETAMLFTTPVTAPDIVITLTPAITPIVIPATGGRFEFGLLIENTGSSTVYYDVWFDVNFPGGSVHGPIALHEDLTLQSWSICSRTLNQSVPRSAPAGDYTYNGKIGIYPNLIFVSDNFPFVKRAGDGPDSHFTDWNLTGWFEDDMETSIEIPESYFLSQNYPNPFNPLTSISFGLPEAGHVKLAVYDLLGRQVALLINGHREAGIQAISFDAQNLAS
ncbi:MAG: C25 family cysteine peptidase, partial [bacterium]